MNPHDEIRNEEQIASLLAALEKDAEAPDRKLLAQLRERSSEAFSQAAPRLLPRNLLPLSRAARWLGAAAAAIVIGIGLYYWLAPQQSGPTFGSLLETVERADTVHLQIVSNRPRTYELWHMNKPRRWRLDDQQGSYWIGDGPNEWIINEKANLVRKHNPQGAGGPVRDVARFRAPLGQVLSLLCLFHPESLLDERPVERLHEDGIDVLLYRMKMPKVQGLVWVEAVLNSETQRLQSLTTTHELEPGTFLKGEGNSTPLGKLTVIAYGEPIGAEKFVIADTLTEDGRIGKVTDVQGIVTVKPVLHERWTPVRKQLVLKPGDWLRTDARGANATALHLVKKTNVILGPKTLVELIGPKQIRVAEGEIEVTAPAAAAVEVLGPQ
jgi:hypothetical protein